ncbi:MAG: M15 family metallopeptidase [Frankiaceae bacterium]
MQAVVLLLLAAAAVSAVGIPATAAGSHSPIAASAAPTGSTLAGRAAATRQRLVVGTRRLEASRGQLASALRRLQQAQSAQVQARKALARATDGLNNFAAAAYRESPDSTIGVLLTERDPQDALAAAGYLHQAGSYRAQVIAALRAAGARAAAAGRAAALARSQATATQQQVFTQVAALQSAAAAAATSLSGTGTASRGQSRLPLPPTDLASLAAAGYPNGLIPATALCSAGIKANVLRCDAAAAFRKLLPAYARAFGRPICVTDSYRSYPQQVAVYRTRPSLAAVPGTSNHGWGLAVDLCGGLQSAGSAQDRWMHANAGRFGWAHPKWAEPGGSRPEPWHWEYVGGGAAMTAPPA